MSRGLRVLMIAPFPRDIEKIVGGVEAATHSLTQALAAHPEIDEILIAALDHIGPPERIRLSDKLTVQFVRPVFLNGDSFLQSAQLAPGMRRLADAFGPDVVHGQGLGRQGRLAVRMGRPAVVTVHGLVNVEARMAATSLAGRIKAAGAERSVAQVLERADMIVSISDYDARELAGRVRSARVSIPNAVPAEFFAAAGKRPTPGVILTAGVMVPRKNLTGLVNAFAAVAAARPDARLVIAGPPVDADYHAEVTARVTQLGLDDKVRILGHVSTPALIEAIADASVLTLFSREETLPTIIAQAMAVGRPVVASDVGGIGEMVVDGVTGWKVPSGDEAALAARLIEVLGDAAEAERMGARGAQSAQSRFTARAVADATVSAYRTAIEARQGGAAGRRGAA